MIISLSLLRLRQALALLPFLFLLLKSCPISSISLDNDDSLNDHDLFLLDDDPSPIQSEGGLPLLAFKSDPNLFDEDEEILDHNKIDEYFEHDYDENDVNYEDIICAANGTCTDADPNWYFDEHQECAFWASEGECTANPSFMLMECAASCQSYDGPDTSVNCPLNETAIPAYKDGEMNAMFQQIADGKWDRYRPNILLRPGERGNEDFPWIVTLDEFLTPEECDVLIAHGREAQFERSTASATLDDAGSDLSSERTSANAWCYEKCLDDPAVRSIQQKIEDLTGVPAVHYEHLQILRYEPGQFYGEHHDRLDYQLERPCGPRILTFLMYLSDVGAGGGTAFTKLGIEVEPKRGMALMWPNAVDGQWDEAHPWTDHEALMVEDGTKYAVNAWIHNYDYMSFYDDGCT